MSAQERKIVSYHEVGHALIAALQKNSEPVQKITIVPRTMGALGYVMHVPEEEKYLNTEAEIHDMLVGYLGGRAAEEIVFDTVTTGASNDIEQATGLARSMVTRFGMSKKFGLIGLESVESQYLDGRTVLNCSDATAAEIDQEVMRILKECYQEALELLSANREVMDQLAAHLIEKRDDHRQGIHADLQTGQGTAAGRTGADCRRADEGGRADCRRREPEPVRCRKQLWHRHRSAAAVFHAEAMGRVRTPAAGKRRQLFLGRYTAAGRCTAAGDPSDAEQSQEQDKPWIPPTPKPENKGPVGRFSGASLPDDEKK